MLPTVDLNFQSEILQLVEFPIQNDKTIVLLFVFCFTDRFVPKNFHLLPDSFQKRFYWTVFNLNQVDIFRISYLRFEKYFMQSRTTPTKSQVFHVTGRQKIILLKPGSITRSCSTCALSGQGAFCLHSSMYLRGIINHYPIRYSCKFSSQYLNFLYYLNFSIKELVQFFCHLKIFSAQPQVFDYQFSYQLNILIAVSYWSMGNSELLLPDSKVFISSDNSSKIVRILLIPKSP